MSWLIPQPKAPKPPTPVPPPERTDAEIAAAAAEQRRRLYGQAPGRRSTLGGGVDPVAPKVATSYSSLLGIA
jgi:hypothetical protein